MGLANVVAGLRQGVRAFDGALGGIGGCPFAPGAAGNVATEDVVFMLQAMGYDTGIDLDALAGAAAELRAALEGPLESSVSRALGWTT
jgi:hydroxymethylglutaryl-CoA lyase